MACKFRRTGVEPRSVGLARARKSPSWTKRAGSWAEARSARSSSRRHVTLGYDNYPKANAEGCQRLFRTGDQGVIDAEGYPTLTGRLKEIIIRGGEKISPREVDEALMDHPAVLQAVTFAIPHPMLGEDVAAAVVLREAPRRPSRTCTALSASAWRPSRRRARSCFSPKSPKAQPASCSASGWRKSLGWGKRFDVCHCHPRESGDPKPPPASFLDARVRGHDKQRLSPPRKRGSSNRAADVRRSGRLRPRA